MKKLAQVEQSETVINDKQSLNIARQDGENGLKNTTYAYFFSELDDCTSIKDFKNKIVSVINSMGFSDFAFMRIDTADEMDTQILSTIPAALTKSYCNEGLYEHDAMIAYAKSGETPIFRSELYQKIYQVPFDNNLTRTSRAIQKISVQHGFTDFYSIPGTSLSNDSRVLFSVAIKGDHPLSFRKKVQDAEESLILLFEKIDYISNLKFKRYLGLKEYAREEERKEIHLTKGTLRVLQHMAVTDYRMKELADKLNLSVTTVNKHLETARRVMGVQNTYAAIIKAYQLGYISFEGNKRLNKENKSFRG